MVLNQTPFYQVIENVDELQCEINAMTWFTYELNKDPDRGAYIRCWTKPEREWNLEQREWSPYRIVLRGMFYERTDLTGFNSFEKD